MGIETPSPTALGVIVLVVGALVFVARGQQKLLTKVFEQFFSAMLVKLGEVVTKLGGIDDRLRSIEERLPRAGDVDDADLVDEDPADGSAEELDPAHDVTPIATMRAAKKRAGQYGPQKPGGKDG